MEKAHVQILPVTPNPTWPQTSNLISQFLFLNLQDEVPSRSNLVMITYQLPFRGKIVIVRKNIHESLCQVFFVFGKSTLSVIKASAKLSQIITLGHPCWFRESGLDGFRWLQLTNYCVVWWFPNPVAHLYPQRSLLNIQIPGPYP